MKYGVKCLAKLKQLPFEIALSTILIIHMDFCIDKKNQFLDRRVDMSMKNNLNLLTIATPIIQNLLNLITGYTLNSLTLQEM